MRNSIYQFYCQTPLQLSSTLVWERWLLCVLSLGSRVWILQVFLRKKKFNFCLMSRPLNYIRLLVWLSWREQCAGCSYAPCMWSMRKWTGKSGHDRIEKINTTKSIPIFMGKKLYWQTVENLSLLYYYICISISSLLFGDLKLETQRRKGNPTTPFYHLFHFLLQLL